MARAAWKAQSCVATVVGQPPTLGEGSARGYVLVCRRWKLVAEVERLRLAQRSARIKPIRGRERGPNRDNRVCKKQHGIVAVKGRSARPGGGKTASVEQARVMGDLVQRCARSVSQDASWRNALFDGRRARSRCGETFTGLATKRSRRREGVWANAKGFVSRYIRAARQARHWFDWRRARRNKTPPRSGEKQTPRRQSTRATFSVVKTLGAWLCVRREATPPGHAANTESVKNPWARDSISSKSERGTGARDWSSRWQKPIVRITRVDRATSQDEARQPNASRRPPWNTAWRGPWPKPRRRGVRSADVFN